MDVSNAADILAGSILTGSALIIITVVIVIINNIFSNYWRPIKWIKLDETPRFVTPDELKEIVKNEIDSKNQSTN
jgi:hypothetical protein